MSAIGIIRIQDDITRSNGLYCSVCFRTSVERRLVEPVFLKIFASKMTGCETFKRRIKACYMCEALAASAVRFYRSVELATKVGELCRDIRGSGQWQAVVKCLIDKQNSIMDPNTMVDPRCGPLEARALRLERELRVTAGPGRTLLRTDTLVVSAADTPRGPELIVVDHDNPAPPPTNQFSDLPPGNVSSLSSNSSTVANSNPSFALSNMVSLSSNVSSLHSNVSGLPINVSSLPSNVSCLPNNVSSVSNNLSSLSNIPLLSSNMITVSNNVSGLSKTLALEPKISVLPDQMQVRVMKDNTDEYILHPMVRGVDGKLYVPSLQLEIQNGGLLKSVPDARLQNCLPQITSPPAVITGSVSPPLQPKTKQQVQHNANALKNNPKTCIRTYFKQKHTDKNNDYYNFLNTQKQEKAIQNGGSVDTKMDDLNIVGKKRKCDPLSDVQLILDKNTQGACEIKYDIDEDSISNETESRPILRTDRTVDWEDKIPMDVISFMDATDPNPQERIMQPPQPPKPPQPPQVMGFISDVRTLDPLAPEIECIDLS